MPFEVSGKKKISKRREATLGPIMKRGASLSQSRGVQEGRLGNLRKSSQKEKKRRGAAFWGACS